MSGAGRDQKGAPSEDERHARLLADLQPLLRFEQVRGRALRGVKLTAGRQLVAHGLGRELVGWQVTRNFDATFDAYEVRPENGDFDPKRHLKLDVGTACTVDLWVW